MDNQLINLLKDFPIKELKKIVELATKKPLGFDMFRPDKAKQGISAPLEAGKDNFINWAVTKYPYDLRNHFKLEEETETETETELQQPKKEIKAKSVDFSNLGKVFEEIFEGIGGSVDKEEVKQIVKELIAPEIARAIKGIQPDLLVIDKVKKIEYKVKGPANKKIIKELILLSQEEAPNGMLIGPAGSGKTFIAGQLAEILGRSFTTLSVTEGISESHLTGWLLPVGETTTGQAKFIHLDAPFLKAYEEGNAVILLDEMDACDPNVLLTINQALANGGFTVAQRHEKSYVKRGDNTMIIGACNTFGSGADHKYVGRSQLDLSTLDRFDMFEIDYDKDLEKSLVGADHVVLIWAEQIRKSIKNNNLNRIFSTRKILNYYKKIESGRYDLEACKKLYFVGWSKDEIALAA